MHGIPIVFCAHTARRKTRTRTGALLPILGVPTTGPDRVADETLKSAAGAGSAAVSSNGNDTASITMVFMGKLLPNTAVKRLKAAGCSGRPPRYGV